MNQARREIPQRQADHPETVSSSEQEVLSPAPLLSRTQAERGTPGLLTELSTQGLGVACGLGPQVSAERLQGRKSCSGQRAQDTDGNGRLIGCQEGEGTFPSQGI